MAICGERASSGAEKLFGADWVRLPGIDGFEVLGRLRAEAATASIPVIILSNYGDPALRDRGLSLGAVDFATKADMTAGQLSAMIKRFAGGPPEPAA